MSWDSLIRPELEPMRPYQPGLRASQVRERSGLEHVLKLSSNEYPSGPVPAAVQAICDIATHVNRYPDGGSEALRDKLSEHLSVDRDTLVVGNGSNELLRLIAQVVLRSGDEVVYSWPSFVVYPMVTDMFGATRVAVPLGRGQVHDLDAMLAAITRRTRLLFLCNPNNPTGSIYGREAFARFLAAVPDHVLVVVDEAYFEFVCDADYPDTLASFDGQRPLVSLRTFSKIYSLAGLRVGYGVLPVPLAEAIHKVREPFNINMAGQAAAYASLDDQVEVARRREENQEQKTYLYSCFHRLGVRYVRSHTNFVWFETERPAEVFEALLRHGVIARDFGGTPALRLGVGTPDDTKTTIAAFEAIVSELGGI